MALEVGSVVTFFEGQTEQLFKEIEKVEQRFKKLSKTKFKISASIPESLFDPEPILKAMTRIEEKVDTATQAIITTAEKGANGLQLVFDSTVEALLAKTSKATEAWVSRVTFATIGTMALARHLPPLFANASTSIDKITGPMDAVKTAAAHIYTEALAGIKWVLGGMTQARVGFEQLHGAALKSRSIWQFLTYEAKGFLNVSLGLGRSLSVFSIGLPFIIGQTAQAFKRLTGQGNEALNPLQRATRLITVLDESVNRTFASFKAFIGLVTTGFLTFLNPATALIAFLPLVNSITNFVLIGWSKLKAKLAAGLGSGKARFYLAFRGLLKSMFSMVDPLMTRLKESVEITKKMAAWSAKISKSSKRKPEEDKALAAIKMSRLPLQQQIPLLRAEIIDLIEKILKEATALRIMFREMFKDLQGMITGTSKGVVRDLDEVERKALEASDKAINDGRALSQVYLEAASIIKKGFNKTLSVIGGVAGGLIGFALGGQYGLGIGAAVGGVVAGYISKVTAGTVGVLKAFQHVFSGPGSLTEYAGKAFNFVGKGLNTLSKKIQTSIGFLILKTVWTDVSAQASKAFNFISGIAKDQFSKFIEGPKQDLKALGQVGYGFLSTAFSRMKPVLKDAFSGPSVIGSLFKKLGGYIAVPFIAAFERVKQAASALRETFGIILRPIKEEFQAAWAILKVGAIAFAEDMKKLGAAVAAPFITAFTKVKQAATSFWRGLTGIFGGVGRFFGKVFGGIAGTVGKVFGGVTKYSKDVYTRAKEEQKKLKEAVAKPVAPKITPIGTATLPLGGVLGKPLDAQAKEIKKKLDASEETKIMGQVISLIDKAKGRVGQLNANMQKSVGAVRNLVSMAVDSMRVVEERLGVLVTKLVGLIGEIGKVHQSIVVESEFLKGVIEFFGTAIDTQIEKVKTLKIQIESLIKSLEKFTSASAKTSEFLVPPKLPKTGGDPLGGGAGGGKKGFTALLEKSYLKTQGLLKLVKKEGIDTFNALELETNQVATQVLNLGKALGEQILTEETLQASYKKTIEIAKRRGQGGGVGGVFPGRTSPMNFIETAGLLAKVYSGVIKSADEVTAHLNPVWKAFESIQKIGEKAGKTGTEAMLAVAEGVGVTTVDIERMRTNFVKFTKLAEKATGIKVDLLGDPKTIEIQARKQMDALISMISRGVKQGIPIAKDAMLALAVAMAAYLPHSDAEEGPFSRLSKVADTIVKYLTLGTAGKGAKAVRGMMNLAVGILGAFKHTLYDPLATLTRLFVYGFTTGIQKLRNVISSFQMSEIATQASEIKLMSERFGIAGERAEQLGYAVEQLGGSATDLEYVFKTVSDNVIEASENIDSEFRQTLDKLGISFTDIATSSEPAVTAMYKFADVLKKHGLASEKSKLAMEAMGIYAGSKLVNLLLRGSEGIKDLSQDANELGFVFKDTFTENSIQIRGFFTKLAKLGTYLRAEFLGVIFPKLIDTLEGLQVKFIEFRPQIVAGLKIFAELLTELGSSLTTFFKSFIDKPKETLDTVWQVTSTLLIGMGESALTILRMTATTIFLDLGPFVAKQIKDFFLYTVFPSLIKWLVFTTAKIKKSIAETAESPFSWVYEKFRQLDIYMTLQWTAASQREAVAKQLLEREAKHAEQLKTEKKKSAQENLAEAELFAQAAVETFIGSQKEILEAKKQVDEEYKVQSKETWKAVTEEAKKAKEDLEKIVKDTAQGMNQITESTPGLKAFADKLKTLVSPETFKKAVEETKKEGETLAKTLADSTLQSIDKTLSASTGLITGAFKKMKEEAQETDLSSFFQSLALPKSLDNFRRELLNTFKAPEKSTDMLELEKRQKNTNKAFDETIAKLRTTQEDLKKADEEAKRYLETLMKTGASHEEMSQVASKILDIGEKTKQADEAMKGLLETQTKMGDAIQKQLDAKRLEEFFTQYQEGFNTLMTVQDYFMTDQERITDEYTKQREELIKTRVALDKLRMTGGIDEERGRQLEEELGKGQEQLETMYFQKLNEQTFDAIAGGVKSAFQVFMEEGELTLDNLSDTFKSVFDQTFQQIADSAYALLKKTLAELAPALGGEWFSTALTGITAIASLVLSKMKSDVEVVRDSVEDAVDSTEQLRGVIAGDKQVGIQETVRSLTDVNVPVVAELRQIKQILVDIRDGSKLFNSGTTIPYLQENF